MAEWIGPDGRTESSYRGLSQFFEYRNQDGELRHFNCGHAAACTFLTHHGVIPTAETPESSYDIITSIERDHPPDNLGGWFGASRRRVERICTTYGVPVDEVDGESELRSALDAGNPVIVMVGTNGPKIWRWHAPAGHWMVAFGYDENYLFLTNGEAKGMPWQEFREWWGSFVPRLVSMRNVGLVARPS